MILNLAFSLISFAAMDFSACSDPASQVANFDKNPTAYGLDAKGWLIAPGDVISKSENGELVRGSMGDRAGELPTSFLLAREKGRPAGVTITWPTAGPKGEVAVVHREFSYDGDRCFITQEWSELKGGDRPELKTVDFDRTYCQDLAEFQQTVKRKTCGKSCDALAQKIWDRNRARIEAEGKHLVDYGWSDSVSPRENLLAFAETCSLNPWTALGPKKAKPASLEKDTGSARTAD